MPYFRDSNETFLSYVHGKNMQLINPFTYSFLTSEVTSGFKSGKPEVYTHNPNLPRYANYLLLLAGIASLPAQVLVISVLATVISLILLRRFFGAIVPDDERIRLIVMLAFAFDVTGFLWWTVNTYRTF